jgi:hypothetical protein
MRNAVFRISHTARVTGLENHAFRKIMILHEGIVHDERNFWTLHWEKDFEELINIYHSYLRSSIMELLYGFKIGHDRFLLNCHSQVRKSHMTQYATIHFKAGVQFTELSNKSVSVNEHSHGICRKEIYFV